MELELIRKRYLGCLFGHAVGNALGLPVEGWRAEHIREKYGALADIELKNFGAPGATDDDTEMMLAIAESYIAYGAFDFNDITDRFVKWFKEDARGIGIQTSMVLRSISSGADPETASKLVWESSGHQSAGNGGLMRCIPTALARINDKYKLIDESRTVSQITHYDPRSTESCVFLNLLVSDLISGNPVELDDYLIYIRDSRVKDIILEAKTIQKEDLRVSGYVLDTLLVAVWAYLNFNSFEDALIEIVNLGGDTDTNGAVVGAVIGARLEIDAIPERWLDALGNKDRLEKAALGLFNLAWK